MTTQAKVFDLVQSAKDQTRRLWSDLTPGVKVIVAIIIVAFFWHIVKNLSNTSQSPETSSGSNVGSSTIPRQSWWTPADEPCRNAWNAKAQNFSAVTWNEALGFNNKNDGTPSAIQLVGESSFKLDMIVNGNPIWVPVKFRCRFDLTTKKACVYTENEAPVEAFCK